MHTNLYNVQILPWWDFVSREKMYQNGYNIGYWIFQYNANLN